MEEITINDFAKVQIKVGEVTKATEVEGSEKLLRLEVDFGDGDTRIVFSGIKKWYKPDELEGRLFCFIVNLQPRKIMDEESQAMILGAETKDGDYILVSPLKITPLGSSVH